MLAGNLEVAGGEIDILACDGGTRVVVEVRTIRGDTDPIEAIDEAKRSRVARLGSSIGADRVDLLGVGLTPEALDIHWLPGGERR